MSIQTKLVVPFDRYLEILGFTSYCYFTNKISKFSGIAGGRTRTLAEYIESFIYGKIAEEAFKLFLEKNFSLKTATEADIADFYYGIYLPDIPLILLNDKWYPMNFWIDVKQIRREQKYLLVKDSSVRTRPYDAYVGVWVGLPNEHFSWMFSEIKTTKDKMSEEWIGKIIENKKSVINIPCEIYGFVLYDELIHISKINDKNLGVKGGYYFDGKTKLFDVDNTTWEGAKVKANYGFENERLKEQSDWEIISEFIRNNKRIIPPVPMPRTKKEILKKTSLLPESYDTFDDFRSAYHDYFSSQLDELYKKHGNNIIRNISWFTQPLS